jgi:hypothetical protein
MLQLTNRAKTIITSVDDYEQHLYCKKFKVLSREGALLLNEIIDRYEIIPIVFRKTNDYLDIINPNCNLYINDETELFNPDIGRFQNIVLLCGFYGNDTRLDKISKIDKSIQGRITSLTIWISKSSELNKICHFLKSEITIGSHFELDEEINIDKIGILIIDTYDNKIIEYILNRVNSIDYLSLAQDKVHLISVNNKITKLFIKGNICVRDKIPNSQNIADNIHIKKIISYDHFDADFENNYTLLEYKGNQESIHRIIERNQELLKKSRFTRTKAIMDH